MNMELYGYSDELFGGIMKVCRNLVTYRTDGIIDDWDTLNEYPYYLRQVVIPSETRPLFDRSLYAALEEYVPTLQILDLRGINLSTQPLLQQFAETESKLRVLMIVHEHSVSDRDLINAIDECPSLESLVLRCMPSMNDNILKSISRLNSLKRLELLSCYITGNGLQAFVDSAPCLEYLSLIDCYNIQTDDIEYARNKLGRRAVKYQTRATPERYKYYLGRTRT